MELLARDLLRIVHVEDSDQFAALTAHTLRSAGFTQPIVRCDDGLLALHYFSTMEPGLAPHVILLARNMPHMNGLEVLHWLRNSHSEPDVAVYFLSWAGQEAAADDDATEYLLKSPLFHELIKNLDSLIATSNAQRLEHARKLGDVMAELVFMSEYHDDLVVLIDTHGRIEWVNEPFVRTSGFTPEELRGKKPGTVLKRRDDPALAAMLDLAVETVRPCECRTLNHRKDGTSYPTHISLGPVFANDRLEGFVAVEKNLAENYETSQAVFEPFVSTADAHEAFMKHDNPQL